MFFQVPIALSVCVVHTAMPWFVLRIQSREKGNMGGGKKLTQSQWLSHIEGNHFVIHHSPPWRGRGNCYETEMAKEQCLITEGQICHQHRRQSFLVAVAREKKMQLTISFGKRRQNP